MAPRGSSDPTGGAVTLDDVSGSDVVFYTPPPVASLNRVPNEVEDLRMMLRGFVAEKIRRAEMPSVEEARKRWIALSDQERKAARHRFGESEQVGQLSKVFHESADRLSERLRAVADPTELILVDEADYLKVTALEQMRSIFDRGGIGLVLIGMPGLEKKLARYPQLYSRVGFVHEYGALSHAEVRKVLAARWWPQGAMQPGLGLADEGSIAAILRITGGNFRLLHRLLTQVGRLLEINGLDAVTSSVVEAARESLVIGAA
jgi:hypothetical protein